jgi:glycogen operon protein
VDDHRLVKLGLKNYWGYNTLSYFAPDLRYASKVQGNSDPVREFKMMVRNLHAAGIEVILDVVYNHTAEGDHLGPTLSFRGIDNPSYYRLSEYDPRLYVDFTGCGNTLNMLHSAVLQIIMDSLRYWILEMHVDGFRFDLASALARELYEVDRLSSFFDIIHQDPVISQAKLIAEPWDLGEGGYQVGNFPVLWTEWNAKYRDIVRKVWSCEYCQINEFATRLSGSSDLYGHNGRNPHASINFVTCHDGFTIQDIAGYNEKHNEANGEKNRDGENYNISYNFGVEGPTDDPEINRRRRRQKRNLMATLIFSLGVPMILGGDELGRTQKGNNNAYCQDNEISWYNWSLEKEDKDFLNFVRKVISIRKRNPVFKRSNFFMGRPIRGSEMKDIAWLTPEGSEMTDKDWNNPMTRAFGVLLGGDALDEVDEMGHRITGDTIFMIINLNHTEEVSFILPEVNRLKEEKENKDTTLQPSAFSLQQASWKRILDTHFDDMKIKADIFPQGSSYILKEHSLALFSLVRRGAR